ncbi:MAG: NAD-dependent epimerase/dehydratase family protein [Betaproteobacteria bacterium]|nr:MAG: NAD-dependent epimerase/dehydratase family protein [Betaproteobacteria bacterium]
MNVFVTGGTGYIGRALITALVARGHAVTALVRPGSMNRVPTGATSISGDPLDAATFEHCLRRDATLVHLVGTRHPGPSKANEFERIDLVSIKASVDAARRAGIAQLVYVSVAQPAPVMRAYVAARAAGEAAISGAKLTATILRPWYVIGPGHRWPILLKPLYWIWELLPPTRDTARRLGLLTLEQMVAALVRAIEEPPPIGTIRIVDVPAIRETTLD